jgi:hypothetical protein
LFNLGKKPEKLEHGARFCGLTILDVGQGATQYRGKGKEFERGTALPWWEGLSDWLEANSGYVHLAEIIATIVLTGATLLLAYAHFSSYARP